MKRGLSCLAVMLLLALPMFVVGQNADDKIYTAVEQMPEFPGGAKALSKYLDSHAVYPKSAKTRHHQATVYVNFVVGSNGKLTDIKVVKNTFADLDSEAVRVVNSMPDWSPGKTNGTAVAVYYTIPIHFVFNEKSLVKSTVKRIEALIEQNKLDRALLYADSLLEAYDESSLAYRARADVYYKMGKFNHACEDIERAKAKGDLTLEDLVTKYCQQQ